jgi:hypothetical protein
VTRHSAYLSIKRHPFFAGLHKSTPPFTLETCDSPAGTQGCQVAVAMADIPKIGRIKKVWP